MLNPLPGALESGNGAKFTPVDHTSLNVSLGSHQTPGTRCFDDPHSITKRVRDMRWAEGQPFLQGGDEQQMVYTAILTSDDAREHIRSPFIIPTKGLSKKLDRHVMEIFFDTLSCAFHRLQV